MRRLLLASAALAMLAGPACAQSFMPGKAAATSVHGVAVSGAARTLSLPSGVRVFDVTLSAATAFTFTGGIPGQYGEVVLVLRQPATGSGFTPTFTNVKWSGGTAPTVSTALGSVTTISVVTDDGGVTYVGAAGV